MCRDFIHGYSDVSISVIKIVSTLLLIKCYKIRVVLVIGKRDISEGEIEIKDRLLNTSEKINIEDIKKFVEKKLNS